MPERAVWTVGLMGGLMALYLMVGVRLQGADALSMAPTPIDGWVPFSVGWLPVYLVMLPMSWAPICAAADRRAVDAAVAGITDAGSEGTFAVAGTRRRAERLSAEERGGWVNGDREE